MRMPRAAVNLLPILVGGLSLLPAFPARSADQQWVVYEGGNGPGKGKNIVFISGDEEYRSEAGLPMLARMLAKEHACRWTVLFSVNPVTGPRPRTTGGGRRGRRHPDRQAVGHRHRRAVRRGGRR